jgi:hypothetical protein
VDGTRNKRATSLTLITPVVLRSLQIRAISTASDTIVSRVDDAFQVHHWALAERAHGYVSQSPARHASLAQVVMRELRANVVPLGHHPVAPVHARRRLLKQRALW